ncbi:recombinase family protein [Alkalihalobacillus pseudalcaliphilus]|uniref:recombinase family protein n=1 Tax=Alkalihalobacillus pseudalcaliphilus TaxID=79884 RepID=UPI00069F67C7|nr:recombinase family protein [Alkalihalobacillus pseudalcaliphilus]
MKCALYVRVSTDNEEQKASLENQQRFFYQFLAEKDWDLYKFYIDVESGTKSKKRESFKQLIQDAKHKKFDIILAKELLS